MGGYGELHRRKIVLPQTGQTRQSSFDRQFQKLKFHIQAAGIIAGRGNTGSRKQAGKIDNVDAVREVLNVGLKAHGETASRNEIGAHRSVERKGRSYASAVEIYAIGNRLSELLEISEAWAQRALFDTSRW